MVDTPARRAERARAQAATDAASAALARGGLTEREWHREVTDVLALAYLTEEDPRWQSGFDGDAALWREARAFLLDAVPATGSFLDVGCANGHLMECVAAWALERGLDLTMYGLELSFQLADEARRRLPALANRISIGNIVEGYRLTGSPTCERGSSTRLPGRAAH